jgi:ATP-binding cassette subfamily B protein
MSTSPLTGKLRRFAHQLTYIPQTVGLIWTASGRWTAAWVVLLIVQGLLPAATVYLTRWVVDALTVAIGGGLHWENVLPVMLPATLIGGIFLLTEAFHSLTAWVRAAQSELVQDHISNLVHGQAVRVDLAFYEMPDYYDQLNRASSEASHRSISLLESGGSFFQNTITFVAMAAILLPYGIWLPLALLISTAPAFYIVLQHNVRYHDWWQKVTVHRRWADYYDLILTRSPTAAEVRLFGLGPYFQRAYQALRTQLRQERLALLKRQSLDRLLVGGVALLATAGAVLWMGWRALQGLLTLGDLALFYQAFRKGQDLMRSLLGSVSQLYTNTLFLENLFRYLQLQPQITDQNHPAPLPVRYRQGIRFRNVTFRYPGSSNAALQNFNLEIPAGQVIAIVGTNGAGKSTLVKLLCRLYDPEEGCVELEGRDIREYAIEEWRRQITVLFQYPVPYHATVRENIALGDTLRDPTQESIEAAARSAGAHSIIERLANGYETMLGKWLSSGTELSGGEWQRLALARAFFREAPILLLDEPTSAMDSWAEIEWLADFAALAQGRTTILVTHRFTTARRADLIYVMDKGSIVESGSHEDLLAQGGFYAQSWQVQVGAIPCAFHLVESPDLM